MLFRSAILVLGKKERLGKGAMGLFVQSTISVRASGRLAFVRSLLVIAPLVGLCACGGGGTGTEGTTTPPAPAPTIFSISGTTTGGANVTVELTGTSARSITTNTAGGFMFTGVPPGAYEITADAPGYLTTPDRQSITVAASNIEGVNFTLTEADDGLSAEVMQELDNAPSTWLPNSEIILPSGKTLEEYLVEHPPDPPPAASAKSSVVRSHAPTGSLPATATPEERVDKIIADMVSSANDYACGRTGKRPCKWNDIKADPNVPNSVDQTGLNYVKGSKTVAERKQDKCPNKQFGVDCSGLVYMAAADAGISAPYPSGNQLVPTNWQLPPEWGVTVEKVTDGSVRAGDLVFWDRGPENRHVVIADSPTHFVGSQGVTKDCPGNAREPRGPNGHDLSYLENGKMGRHHFVLRFTPKPPLPECASTNNWEGVFRYNITQYDGINSYEVVSVGGGQGTKALYLDMSSGSPPRLRLSTKTGIDAAHVSLHVNTTAPYQDGVQSYQLEAPGAELWNDINFAGCLVAEMWIPFRDRRGCFQFTGTLNVVSKTPVCTEGDVLFSTLEVGFEGASPVKEYGNTSLGPVIVDRGYAKGVFKECVSGTTPTRFIGPAYDPSAFTCLPQ